MKRNNYTGRSVGDARERPAGGSRIAPTLVLLILLLFITSLYASQITDRPLLPAKVNINDSASLQRGARNFMNYCAGCHSLQYISYEQMAERIQLYNSDHEIYTDLLQANLIFTRAPIEAPIVTAMTHVEAKAWLGAVPPDLSLIIKARGANWVYTYLNSFYYDPNRPWGTNNLLLRNTAMPNVLLNVQGEQEIIYQQDGTGDISHLLAQGNGNLTPEQFQQFTQDVVNFLTVVAEPPRPHKIEVGFWFSVILLLILLIGYVWRKFSAV